MTPDNIFTLIGLVVGGILTVGYVADKVWHIVTDGKRPHVERKINFVEAHKIYNSLGKGRN